jgi:hypothetical protein
VLQKALLYSAVALAILKFAFRITPRELARRLDRWVNPAIAFLLLAYGAHFVYWFLTRR